MNFTELFLEATHLKAVRAAAAVLRGNPRVVEVQVVGVGACGRRRPAEPVLADAVQRIIIAVAVAPGEGVEPSACHHRWFRGRLRRALRVQARTAEVHNTILQDSELVFADDFNATRFENLAHRLILRVI